MIVSNNFHIIQLHNSQNMTPFTPKFEYFLMTETLNGRNSGGGVDVMFTFLLFNSYANIWLSLWDKTFLYVNNQRYIIKTDIICKILIFMDFLCSYFFKKSLKPKCLIAYVLEYTFTKLSQIVCLINTHILIYRYTRYDSKLWNSPWFYCVIWIFSYIIDEHSSLYLNLTFTDCVSD